MFCQLGFKVREVQVCLIIVHPQALAVRFDSSGRADIFYHRTKAARTGSTVLQNECFQYRVELRVEIFDNLFLYDKIGQMSYTDMV